MSDPTLEFTKDRECASSSIDSLSPPLQGAPLPRFPHSALAFSKWKGVSCLQHSRQSRRAAQNRQAQVRPHMWNDEPTVRPSWSFNKVRTRADKPRGSDRLCPQTGNCFHKPHLIHVGSDAGVSNYSRSPDVQHLGVMLRHQLQLFFKPVTDNEFQKGGRMRLGNNDSKHLGFYM